jgi:hypothetical protein
MFPRESDRAIATVVAASMRKAGMSESDIDRWLEVGREGAMRAEAGQFASQEEGLAWTARAAETAGISIEQVGLVSELPMYDAWPTGEPRGVPFEPLAAEDKATIAAAEAGMKDGSYWRNEDLQTAYSDALDRQAERAELSASKPSRAEVRSAGRQIAEQETAMKADMNAYWADPSKQNRFRDLISAQQGGGAASRPPNADRIREIEASMYDAAGRPNPNYWQNDRVQAEYRGLIQTTTAAAGGEQEHA